MQSLAVECRSVRRQDIIVLTEPGSEECAMTVHTSILSPDGKTCKLLVSKGKQITEKEVLEFDAQDMLLVVGQRPWNELMGLSAPYFLEN